MSLLAMAALALEAGPAVIRGVSSLFGGSETADKVANVVEKADALLMPKEQKAQFIEGELNRLPPEQLVELEQIKLELEKDITRRQQIAAEDRQAEHHETQVTIRNGDNAADRLVRLSRPLMALISCSSASYYVISNPKPDLAIAAFLVGLAATYMGLRHREKDKGLTQ